MTWRRSFNLRTVFEYFSEIFGDYRKILDSGSSDYLLCMISIYNIIHNLDLYIGENYEFFAKLKTGRSSEYFFYAVEHCKIS